MLKKIGLSLLSAAVLTTGLVASMSSSEKKEIVSLPIFQGSNITIDKSIDLGDVYMIRAKGGANQQDFEFFVSKDKKVVIVGKGMNSQTREPFTTLDNSVLEGKENFSYGTGKKVLYVFTDPECPYCKTFEKTMPGLKDKYTFKIFLLALPFHKQAPAMMEYILTGKNDAEKASRLLGVANGSNDYKTRELTVEQEKQVAVENSQVMVIAKKIALRGTPTVLDTNMKPVVWNTLK